MAAAFPFASYELSDRNGIFLGLNLYNRSPVFLDPYDDYKYTNSNWWLGGTSGAGKTVPCNVWADVCRGRASSHFHHPKKGHEVRPCASSWAACTYVCHPLRGIAPTSWLSAALHWTPIPGSGADRRDDSVLADKISRLIIWYSSAKRDLSDAEDKNYLVSPWWSAMAVWHHL